MHRQTPHRLHSTAMAGPLPSINFIQSGYNPGYNPANLTPVKPFQDLHMHAGGDTCGNKPYHGYPSQSSDHTGSRYSYTSLPPPCLLPPQIKQEEGSPKPRTAADRDYDRVRNLGQRKKLGDTEYDHEQQNRACGMTEAHGDLQPQCNTKAKEGGSKSACRLKYTRQSNLEYSIDMQKLLCEILTGENLETVEWRSRLRPEFYKLARHVQKTSLEHSGEVRKLGRKNWWLFTAK